MIGSGTISFVLCERLFLGAGGASEGAATRRGVEGRKLRREGKSKNVPWGLGYTNMQSARFLWKAWKLERPEAGVCDKEAYHSTHTCTHTYTHRHIQYTHAHTRTST